MFKRVLLLIVLLGGLTNSLFFTNYTIKAAVSPVLNNGPSRPHARLLKPQATVGNLTYGGGKVMVGPVVNYAIYWGNYPATDQSIINDYFNRIDGTPIYNIATQYYQLENGNKNFISNNTTFGGAWVDTQAPGGKIFDADIRAEVQKAMQQNGWATGLNHQFFVYTQPGTVVCFDGSTTCSTSAFCAYHSWTNSGTTIYASIPFPSLQGCHPPVSPNNNITADSAVNSTSHEQFEAVTDPLFGFSNGWTGPGGLTSEIGDECYTVFGPALNSSGANVILNGRGFIIQTEWSNAANGCALTYGNIKTSKAEAESLASTTNGPSNTISNDSNCSGNVCMVFKSTAVGNVVTYKMQVPAAGIYDVRVGVKKLNNKGIFQFASNGINHGTTQDLYAPTATYVETDIGNVQFNTAGTKSFTFTVTSKNPSSTDYSLGIDYIKLIQ